MEKTTIVGFFYSHSGCLLLKNTPIQQYVENNGLRDKLALYNHTTNKDVEDYGTRVNPIDWSDESTSLYVLDIRRIFSTIQINNRIMRQRRNDQYISSLVKLINDTVNRSCNNLILGGLVGLQNSPAVKIGLSTKLSTAVIL